MFGQELRPERIHGIHQHPSPDDLPIARKYDTLYSRIHTLAVGWKTWFGATKSAPPPLIAIKEAPICVLRVKQKSVIWFFLSLLLLIPPPPSPSLCHFPEVGMCYRAGDWRAIPPKPLQFSDEGREFTKESFGAGGDFVKVFERQASLRVNTLIRGNFCLCANFFLPGYNELSNAVLALFHRI